MNRRRTVSAVKIALAGLALVVLLLTIFAWWLLRTSSGAAWLWSHVEDAAAGSVRSSQVGGNLASGFTIQGFEYGSGSASLSIRVIEVEARPGFWPLSVQVRSLALRDVDIVRLSTGGDVQSVEPSMDIHTMLEALSVPFPVRIDDTSISNVTFQTGDEAPRTLVKELRFGAALDERLLVEDIELLATGIEANINGQMSLESPYDLAVSVEGRMGTGGEADTFAVDFPFRLYASGNPDNIEFTLASVGDGLGLGTELLDLDISGTVSAQGLQLASATLTGAGVKLESGGTLDWSPQVQAGLKLAIHRLDLSPWVSGWPAGESLLGDLELGWSGSGLKIPVGELRVDGTGLLLNIKADVDVNASTVIARIDWTDLAWPLADPDFASPLGSLSANGSIDAWEVDGQLDIVLGDYPRGSVEVEGAGNQTSAQFTILQGEVLGGSIAGEAGADWQDGLVWDMNVRTMDVNPEPLLPGWPGRIDAEIEAGAGKQSELTEIKLVSLQGVLRGVGVSGHGSLSVEGEGMKFDGLTFSDVELRTDKAVLQLDGSPSEPAGVSVKFSGDLPSMLLQGATGNVELEGTYSGKAGSSSVDVQMEALDLAWNGISVKGLSVSMQSADAIVSVPVLQLDAVGLAWQDYFAEEFSLSLAPAGERHRLRASMAGKNVAMNLAMHLEAENKSDALSSPWRGVMDEFVLSVDQEYRLDLQEPAPLEWLNGSLSIGPVCLHENNGAGLCASGDYKNNGDWSLVADITGVSLNYLRDFQDLDVHFEQYVEGRLDWHQLNGEAPTGGADFRIIAGRVLDLDDNDVLTETSEGRFGFRLRNGNLESGVLDVEFPGVGFIDVDFSVLDFSEDGERRLQGRAVTRLDDLKLVGQMAFTAVDETNGQFESNIKLGGTLADPSFDGGFRLSNGLVRYAPIGLKLEKIEFEGLLEKLDRGTLKGEFQAGEGVGSIDGQFLFKDFENIKIDVALSGDQLLLVNTDDLQINTETDLRIGLSPQRMDINGNVRIPNARLTPSNLVLEKVSDSEDLVIEASDRHIVAEIKEPPSTRKIYGQLEVAFGDDVFIAVPDVEANISGSVLYNWTGDPVPLAEGSYRLQGKVDVYGPTLTINNGSISFPGIPANNPLLNIRAERDIFGNTQIRSAGVQVIGSLKRPVLEAYTVPITTEDRAWTLLITGTDFDQGQGVGGFDVGTYIAPKLYISYGISLFEDENVISARYDLKKGFGVKVTSGQRETGLDVSYTLDRD